MMCPGTRPDLTAIGRRKGEPSPPHWVDLCGSTGVTSSLTKFAPGWDVNVPLACRVVGDNLEGREDECCP